MNTFRGDSAVTAQLSGISTGGVSEGVSSLAAGLVAGDV